MSTSISGQLQVPQPIGLSPTLTNALSSGTSQNQNQSIFSNQSSNGNWSFNQVMSTTPKLASKAYGTAGTAQVQPQATKNK